MFYGKLRNVKDLKQLIKSTLNNFHLKAYRNVLVKNLSGGNKRKLNVACASLANTNVSICLMDEPCCDMDPLTRNLVYKTIRDLNDNNCSVILTSHDVPEIEKICHKIGILVDGNLVSNGTAEQLKKHFGNRYVVTMFSDVPLDVHFENVSL
jgi:ABC-2 type transport system ATP-binding protein